MDCRKIGRVIKDLRLEKEMTQVALADQLNISPKTISKWECGMGCPDISLLVELASILEVDVVHLLKGQLVTHTSGGGNMKNIKFYVCPKCGHFTMATGAVQVTCCGRTVEDQPAKKADDLNKLRVESDHDQWYITSDHVSHKDNYISFVAYLVGGGMQVIKLYPEWEMHIRLTKQGRGKLLWYSSQKGLMYQNI